MTNDGQLHQELLTSLDEEQKLCVTELSPALCIVAPAGSGKTTVLTRRIAYRIKAHLIQSNRVLAISYTRSAAYQLKRRTEELLNGQSIQAGTFHSVALKSLKRYWAHRGIRTPSILDRREPLIALALAETEPQRRPVNDVGTQAALQQTVRMVSEVIALAKAVGLTPHTLRESARLRSQFERLDPQVAEKIFLRYEQLKAERNLIDFDDILSLCATALANDEQFADGERFLYREIYVDEFQDMSPSQVHVLRGYLGESDRLTIVGDPRQSIYGFNGSDPNLMHEMSSDFPQMKTIHLTKNYRSTPELFVSANSVLRDLPHNIGGAPGSAARLAQPNSHPQIFALEDEGQETTIALRYIKEQLYRGVPPRSIAALGRTHHVLQPLRVALDRAAIPYHTADTTNSTTSEDARVALKEIIHSYPPRSLTELRDILESHLEGNTPNTPSPEVIHRLHEAVARARREDSSLSITEFVELFEDGAFDTVAKPQGVTLSTFHRAKGLQWHHVHLLGVEDGLVPHSRARTKGAIEEERRLLYVAMTRASNSLVITYVQTRVLNARLQKRRPSPFLDSLTLSESNLTSEGESLDRAKVVATIGETFGGTRDLLILQRHRAIEQWRVQAARASRITPTSVLDDRTLRSLSTDVTLKDERELANRLDPQTPRSPRHRRELLQLLVRLNQEYDNTRL